MFLFHCNILPCLPLSRRSFDAGWGNIRNWFSKDLSSENDDLWNDRGPKLRLLVMEIRISLSFLKICIWPSTNHREHVRFMWCQILQHASLSLLVLLTICYHALCCVENAPVCLICNGRQGLGGGGCVFNYHLVEWLMVRQSSTELQLSACVCVRPCVTLIVRVQARMCFSCQKHNERRKTSA